jgi:phosphoglycerol transferase MdoB-like AlkP superfamily enzyme
MGRRRIREAARCLFVSRAVAAVKAEARLAAPPNIEIRRSRSVRPTGELPMTSPMDRARIATIPPLANAAAAGAVPFATSRSTRWTAATAVTSSVVLAVLLFACVQRPALSVILTLGQTMRPGPEPWLLPLALVSTTLIVLAPGALLSAILARLARPRASRSVYLAASSALTALTMVDLDLLRSIGRHVSEIAVVALQPQGHVAGGGLGAWMLVVGKWSFLAVFGTSLVTFACERAVPLVASALTPLLRRTVALASTIAVLMAITAPLLLLQAWRNNPVVERLYASSLIDPRGEYGSVEDQGNLEPGLRDLYSRFRNAYKAAFPGVTTSKPADDTKLSTLVARPPNVVLIVTESFRHDVFGPELMPRMARWAEGGLVATRHDSGTTYSESGMFSLLYGRSPALFHQTLDAQVPPQLCVTLRNSGYECAFFTGHPKVWQRREEYLNDQTMDHFVHDDRGSWPEWDQRALDGMVQRVNTSEKPVFAIVLLMSSHFEYQYPPSYEIDRPVADSVWRTTIVNTLGPDAEVPHRNRYRNCMRFIDDVVAKSLERIDPDRNLVIFTGDHGESIYDDGHYTHGYSFGEIVTRVPFAMVGPGIEPRKIDTPTSHIDLLPSVLHVLSGKSYHPIHSQGIDWFSGERRSYEFEAHSPHGGHVIEAQLRAAGHRLRIDLGLGAPSVTLLGFENELGQLMATPALSEHEITALAVAFEDELSNLRR